MKALLLVAAIGVALLAPTVAAGPYFPPVCLQKSVDAANTHVTAQLTCEVWVEITHCPIAGSGPCWAVMTEPLP